MIKKINLLEIFFLILIVQGCSSQDKPKDFDYGHVENNKYVNSFFDFEISLHPDWIVQAKDQMESTTKIGKDLVAGDDSKMKALLKASEINTARLLSISQFERGSAVEYNPSMALIAESTKKFPGIKNGGDYLFQTRRLMKQSQFKYDSIDKEFTKEVINGTDFYKMNANIKYLGLDIKQVYYSTISKEFSFNVIISFINDQQKQHLLELINSMKFKN